MAGRYVQALLQTGLPELLPAVLHLLESQVRRLLRSQILTSVISQELNAACLQVCPRCCLRLVNSRSAYDAAAPTKFELASAISQSMAGVPGRTPAALPEPHPAAAAAAAQLQKQALPFPSPAAASSVQPQEHPRSSSGNAGMPHAAGASHDDHSIPAAVPAEHYSAQSAAIMHEQSLANGSASKAQEGVGRATSTVHQHHHQADDAANRQERAAAANDMQQQAQADADAGTSPCSICLGVLQSVDGQIGSAASNTLLKKFSKDDNSAGTWTPLQQCTVDAVAQAIR